jgi:hypothetical protein
VEVLAESPVIRRTLDVEVRRKQDGSGEFSIDLSSRLIEGEILTETGEQAERALLHVVNRTSGERSSEWIQGGRFQMGGLEPGSYTLSAGAGRVASDDVPVTLPKEGGVDPVKLILKKKSEIRIKVLGPSGTGLPGVPVEKFAAATGWGSQTKLTGADGRVAFEAPPAADGICVLVRASGLPVRFARPAVSADEQVVQLDRSGGFLELEYPTPSEAGYPMLRYGLCEITPTMLASLTRSGSKKVFPSVATGEYSLCSYSLVNGIDVPGACKSGTLSAFGGLKLSLITAAEKQVP